MKKSLYLVTALVLSSVPTQAFARARSEIIVNHCDNVRDIIKTVQYDDAGTRANYGNYYETILSNYIKPLNTRLVNNNIANSELMDIQIKYVAQKNTFNADYISYSESLNSLLDMDCKQDPLGFYNQLIGTRIYRNSLAKEISQLDQLIEEFKAKVSELKEQL